MTIPVCHRAYWLTSCTFQKDGAQGVLFARRTTGQPCGTAGCVEPRAPQPGFNEHENRSENVESHWNLYVHAADTSAQKYWANVLPFLLQKHQCCGTLAHNCVYARNMTYSGKEVSIDSHLWPRSARELFIESNIAPTKSNGVLCRPCGANTWGWRW